MEIRDLLVDTYGRVEESMRICLDGLQPEQLVFRPAETSNSIGWLAWHLTRVQDHHLSDLAERPQAWVADGWHARFDKPAVPGDTGFGYTPEQVAAIRPASAQLLLDYFEAVHQRSLEYLRRGEPAD